MRIFKNLNVDFLIKRKYFYIISSVIFIVGIINILFRGLEFGIDFLGGSEIALEFEKPIEISPLRNYVDNIGLGKMELKTFGSNRAILLRSELQELPPNISKNIQFAIKQKIEKQFPGLSHRIVSSTASSFVFEFENKDTINEVSDFLFNSGYQTVKGTDATSVNQLTIRTGLSDWMKESLRDHYPDNYFKVLKENRVGPKVGKELKQSAVIALFLALVAILIYLAIRFKFIFAVGAVLALFHDVLITLGLYSILYGLIPGLNLEIDLTIVGAFLTIIGYSVSDTVVIFDRVRENLKLHKTLPIKENINKSLNQTMSRTVLTGGTTLVSLFVLVLFGGEVLRAFAFTLFFGIIIGTYSSIFVASALVYDYAVRSKRKIEF
jgi:preprotein translocase SecF subunit